MAKGKAVTRRRRRDSGERGAVGAASGRAGGRGRRRKQTSPKGGARRRGATVKKGETGGVERGVRGRSTSFPRLGKGGGCAAMLRIAEHAGGQHDEIIQVCVVGDGRGGRGATGRGKRALAGACAAMMALGHVQRGRMMGKLLEGPATYRALQKVTALKAGPLYHHINQLRLAGLILPKQRDLYELTRGGRNLILAAMLLGPAVRDRRRRPM